MHRSETGRLVPSALGTGVGAMLIAMLGGVALIAGQLGRDAATSAAADDGFDAHRHILRAEMLDFECSDDCSALMRATAESPDVTWESVVRLAEAEGLADVRYTIKVRWWLDDGSYDDLGYFRRPVLEPWNAREFLRLAADGPEAAISETVRRPIERAGTAAAEKTPTSE